MTGSDPTSTASSVPPVHEGPPFWLTASSYWVPAHFSDSAWVSHAPFAFWLMDVLRPRSIVELGTFQGFSCFVFAEGARRLGLDCSISALDSWEGDDHAGHYGDWVYAAVASVATKDYPDSVRLVRGYFEQSRPLFSDDSVDLLHIDGRHGYEDVLADFTAWQSTVRQGGIILFHDIAEHERGFGVWKLWEELRGQHPSFEFEHGHGLGVLAIGEGHAAPLRALFEADDATATRIRAEYERLGAVVERWSWLEAMPAELDKINASKIWRWSAPLRSFLHQRALRKGGVVDHA